MGDSPNRKQPSIPSWQLAHKSEPEPSSAEAKSSSHDDESSTNLFDQARQWLQDEQIRSAPSDKKKRFLESKGLTPEDIAKLLPEQNTTPEPAPAPPSSPTEEKVNSASTITQAPSSTPISSNSSSLPVTTAPPTTTTPTSAPAAATVAPPIITYPESLIEAAKPPPLFTISGLITTLYGATGLAAACYGANRYLITPSLAALTQARGELADTAERNLQTLNDRLERVVSTVPPEAVRARSCVRTANRNRGKGDGAGDGADGESDGESDASDPTELFNVNAATQTDVDLLASSTPSLSVSESSFDRGREREREREKPSSAQLADVHTSRLCSLTSKLRSLHATDNESSGARTQQTMREVNGYLENLAYSNPMYMSPSLYGIYGMEDKKRDDAISTFRSEIRVFKGMLLSAKNFPAGSRTGFSR